MEWAPRDSDEVVNVPLPPLRVTVPSELPLSERVTTPVAAGLTETETVTGWPIPAGFGEALNVVVGGRLVTGLATPPETVPVPRVASPSLKVTVPDAVDGCKVAVRVTAEPAVDGDGEAVSVVWVWARTIVSVAAAEVLGASEASPA